MDAFQCRMQFTRQISTLTASAAVAKSCAQFALKNRDFDEDLFSVIMEQLESKEVSMNTRINILYFLETLLDLSTKSAHRGYIPLIQHSLIPIITSVASADPEGAANIATVKKVLDSFKRKGIVSPSTDSELTRILQEREELYKNDDIESNGEKSDEDVGSSGSEDSESRKKKRKSRFDEAVVRARMEEDRERHKRLRENIWQVPVAEGEGKGKEDWEFEKAWEETSDLNEDDYEIMREENEILKASIL